VVRQHREAQFCQFEDLHTWIGRTEGDGWLGKGGGARFCQFKHLPAWIGKTEGVGGCARAGGLSFANSSTCVLELAEPRVASGWIRARRLSCRTEGGRWSGKSSHQKKWWGGSSLLIALKMNRKWQWGLSRTSFELYAALRFSKAVCGSTVHDHILAFCKSKFKGWHLSK